MSLGTSLLSKLEKLDVFGSNLMFILESDSRRTAFNDGGGPRLFKMFFLLASMAFLLAGVASLSFSFVGGRARTHYFKLFFETRFIDFLFFELLLQGNDVIEGS